MDELLSLFNADDNAGGNNDTSRQETQPATQTRKTKYQGAPSSSTNNDFGSSFASAFATSNTTSSRTINEENILNKSRVAKQHHTYTTTKTTATHKHKSNNTTTCDPYTNFVITDRRTSRANMVNAFSSLTYKSCSVLAASSRAEWNTFMVDGGGISSNGALSGKTKLATCGILTQDVSSKLSSKTGRAFAKLLLGDLPSSSSSSNNMMHSTIARGNNINPSITVFLFGDAINILKTNMKYMKAGYAIAVLQPNLMPNNTNNNGGGTSTTLSINDPSQLLPIGRASDVNKCKGSMRVRTQSEYGAVKWEDARCTTLVDCRLGSYCDKHKKQGLGNGKGSSTSNKSNNNSLTFMQKQRAQQHQGMSQMRGDNKRGGDVWVGHRGGHTNLSSFNNLGHQGGRSTTSSSLSEALSQSGLLGQQSKQPISSSLGSKQQLLKRAPLHMKKSQPVSSSTTGGVTNKLAPAMASTSSSTTKNPYNNKSSQSKSSNPRKRKEVDDILGEALGKTKSSDESNHHHPGKNMKKKKTSLLSSSTTTKRPVKVFTTEGYDGSVHVPKPNKLLFQRGATSLAASSMITPSPDNNRSPSALILDKQRSLAELLKRKQGSISTTPATNMKRSFPINKDTLARSKQKIVSTTAGGIKVVKRSTNSSQSKTTNKYNDFASAFGSTGGGGLSSDADIMNAKSRFSSVTDAQEYARARAQVQELEAQEARKEGYNDKKKKNKSNDVAIRTTGWACRTCKKTTPFKPVACIKARHDVRQKREIKGQETLSKRKDRLDRHGKDEKEGGLALGSGVEWTRLEWSRGGL